MTTSISQPQHTLESICGPKMSPTSGHSVSEDATTQKSIDLSPLEQPYADLYECGKQIVEKNKHLQANPRSEPSSPSFHSTPATDFEAVSADSKQLDRELKLSDDDYAKMGRSALRSDKSNENKETTSGSKMGPPPHIEVLETLIDNIHTNYQKTYADINKAAAEYMRDVNTAVGKIGDFIKSGENGKIKFESFKYLSGMDGVFKKYTNFDVAAAGAEYAGYKDFAPKTDMVNSEGVTEKKEPESTKYIIKFNGDAKSWRFWEKKLSGFTVKLEPGTPEQIIVKPNLDPIRNIYRHVVYTEASWEGGKTSPQALQSLQSAIDSQKNAVNSSVSQLLETFRQDNSTFETLIQLLQQMGQDLHRYNSGYHF